MATKLNVRDFFKQYPTDESCLEHVMDVRYGRYRDCPKCAKKAHFYRLANRPAYTCEYCGHHIYPCAGTPFMRTRTPLQMWFYALYLFTTTRHGVSAKELQRQLSVTYKTAWRMGHEIRKHMGKIDGDGGPFTGQVELDETYVGGKGRWPEDMQKGKPGENSKKTIVFGMVQRGGNLITHVVPNAKRDTLFPYVTKQVAPGSTINTDEWMGYRGLRKLGYKHQTVNHRLEQWVNGLAHTNTIEGFWSHFKNSVRGTHKSISKKHMMKYLGEFEFRFNLRKTVSSVMFDRLIRAF